MRRPNVFRIDQRVIKGDRRPFPVHRMPCRLRGEIVRGNLKGIASRVQGLSTNWGISIGGDSLRLRPG